MRSFFCDAEFSFHFGPLNVSFPLFVFSYPFFLYASLVARAIRVVLFFYVRVH